MKLKGKIWVEGYALEEDYDEVSEGAGKIKEEGDDESDGDGEVDDQVTELYQTFR